MVILNIRDAAQFLGKTPAALRNGYKRWGVPHFRLGGQIKFTQEALQEWVNRHMTELQTDTTLSRKERQSRTETAQVTQARQKLSAGR